LFRNIPNSIDRTIALSLAGLILFIVANVFPFLSFEVGNQTTQSNLFTGVRQLYAQGIWLLAGLVFFTSILAPLLQLLLMLYVFIPIKFDHVARYTRQAFRVLRHIRDWNMIEVFMIGILVALVKLTKMATIVPGIAMWSFLVLIFLVTGASASIDGRIVWRRLDQTQ
jgi:paraquat-inducible protein A